jgi:putative tryptophan/tyrosine transport system substrate-binding protein
MGVNEPEPDGPAFTVRIRPEGQPRSARGALAVRRRLTCRANTLDLIRPPHHDPGMDRRRFLVTLLAGVLAAPLAAEAQPLAKIHRVGVLSAAPATAVDEPGFNALREALRELGHVEGKNIALEFRLAGGYQRLPALAADLVRVPVDVIVTDGGEPPVRAAMNATRSIPIVMATIGDPVAAGVVASLAKPGGNVTGFTLAYPELAGKRLQLLKEMVPTVTHVAVLWDQTMAELQLRPTETAARSLGLSLESLPVRGPADIEAAFQTAARQRAGALVQLASRMLSDHKKRIVELAAKHRLPGLFELGFEDTDALACYGPRVSDNFRRTAVYVDKILKGARPGDLPIQRPATFHLVISRRTARALGLTIPPSVLLQATRIIE